VSGKDTLKRRITCGIWIASAIVFLWTGYAPAVSDVFEGNIYDPGELKPTDSKIAVSPGDPAPDFTLPSLSGNRVTLSDFEGIRNVVISFAPAAWTPVCSDQWPGYNLIEDVFKKHDARLFGITVDNIPTLFAWTRQMGELWFPVLSDFWPHGKAAESFGLLRSDGMTERAVVMIDKQGIVRYIEAYNINRRPRLEKLVGEMEKHFGSR
jgi:peroxiredoxin (alkyl hydroperoxide reductase subunit C)